MNEERKHMKVTIGMYLGVTRKCSILYISWASLYHYLGAEGLSKKIFFYEINMIIFFAYDVKTTLGLVAGGGGGYHQLLFI